MEVCVPVEDVSHIDTYVINGTGCSISDINDNL